MATIHSLPAELITHILRLAYGPSPFSFTGPDHSSAYTHSKLGLRLAALVHSSWYAPAQELLTAELVFSRFSKPTTLALFLSSVPAGFRTDRLELFGLREPAIRGVVGHARAGGVRGLRLWGRVPADLFKLPGMAGESSKYARALVC